MNNSNNHQPPQHHIKKRKKTKKKKRELLLRRIIVLVCLIAFCFLVGFLITLAVRGIISLTHTSESESETETEIVTDTESETEAKIDGDTESETAYQTETEKESGIPQFTLPEVTFTSDLSAYESYMNPTGAERDAYLLLVNSQNPLGEDYYPTDLIDVTNSRYSTPAKMVKNAAMALEAFFIEMKNCGYTDVSVTSGFRDYATQKSYFNLYVNREMSGGLSYDDAVKEVLTYSCREGTSEHQSGLCCDMHNLSAADISFAYTEAGKWMAENCWKFGFILRFPEDKTDITTISYEPWHFRYVGRYHAYYIHEHGLCLEEYIELIGD